MAPKRNIVIVGGGGAGAQLAYALGSKADGAKCTITLISKHAAFHHFPSSIRPLISEDGKLEEKVFITYDKLFPKGNGKFVQATVTAIKSDGRDKGGKVALEDGETIGYDVLILATGNTWEGTVVDFPIELEEAQGAVRAHREKVKQAKNIVIAGGGPVGIELAGEIKYYYPEKKVTIVHGQSNMLNASYPDKFRNNVTRRLKNKKINVILDDFIEDVTNPKGRTRKGVELSADLIISARGSRPSNQWIAQSLGQDILSERGYVKVRSTLQVEGYDRIIAMGDMIEWDESKMLGKILLGHLGVASANVLDILEDRTPKKLYKSTLDVLFLTMGKNAGAGWIRILWGLIFGDWVVSSIKGKHLFLSRTRQAVGHAD